MVYDYEKAEATCPIETVTEVNRFEKSISERMD